MPFSPSLALHSRRLVLRIIGQYFVMSLVLGHCCHHPLSADKSDLDCYQDSPSTPPMTMTMTLSTRMRSMAMAMTTWRGSWSCGTITPSWTPAARGSRSPPGPPSDSSAASTTSAVSVYSYSVMTHLQQMMIRGYFETNVLFLQEK